MEIERKWLVEGWPDMCGEPVMCQEMEQGYLVVRPTVRIRKEQIIGQDPEYILCIKSGGGLAREEIEVAVSEEKYNDIRRVIARPMIRKERRTYAVSGGLHLEVNLVDQGTDTQFMYAEIEFDTIEAAKAWHSDSEELSEYLKREVTDDPGQSMGAYWIRTREADGIRRN